MHVNNIDGNFWRFELLSCQKAKKVLRAQAEAAHNKSRF